MAKQKEEPKIEFKTEWFSIESESPNRVSSFRGKPFYRFNIPDSVMVLPITENGRIILIRQYRRSVRSHTLELPCGMIDKDETPRQAAIRELLEETGYMCGKIDLLCIGRPWIDRSDSKLYVYFGRRAARRKGVRPQENIKTILVTPEEFKKLAARGKLQQLQSFAPIFLAKLKFGLEI